MHGNSGALKRLLPLFAVLLPAVLMGQENPNSVLDSLRGSTFQLRSAAVGDRQFPLPAEPAITIRFDGNGKVSGHSLINLYFGSLGMNPDGTLNWGPEGWALTRRAGLPALMDLENLYLQVLERTTNLSTDGSTLTFSSEDPAIALVFERLIAKPLDVADITGKPLTLTSLIEDGRNLALPAKPALSMTINSNGTCAGFSGVNRFFGRFAVDAGGAVNAGPFGSTMMAGPEELMQIESAFHKALGSVKRIETAGRSVRLLDAAGAAVLVFEAR